jgi:osmotically-inducible protein OsmY
MKISPTMTMTTMGALLVSLALAGCNRPHEDTQTASADSDRGAVVQGQPSALDTAAKASHDAAEATRQAATEAKEASKNAADQASNKVADALITTSVKTELAKDPKLSSLRINVDTDNGRVALHGTAPDPAAKERATQLASNVKGVVSVDNQLIIEGKQG